MVGQTLALLLNSYMGVEHEAPNPRYCPSASIGYVRVIKDGVVVAGGTAKWDASRWTLTAWFPSQKPITVVRLTLVMKPGENLQIHTAGMGSIKLHHFAFCAFPEPPPIPSYDYPKEPSASPTELPSSPPAVYSLDGISLGSRISDYAVARGTPEKTSFDTFAWTNGHGGTLSVKIDSTGRIILIDLKAGASEIRSVDVLGRSVRLNDGGHINNPPPVWVNYTGPDVCSPQWRGSPCEIFFLPRDAELVMNFGGDNGMADWNLTEIVIASRSELFRSGLIVNGK